MCLVCLDKIGDEFHFLLECPRHQSLRSRLIGRYYWNRPSMLKLQQLLNSTCTKVIRGVAKFVYKAFNDLWFYAIHACGFCMCWYPVAILCFCVRHADQMFLSRRTFVRARGPKTIIKSLNPWIFESIFLALHESDWFLKLHVVLMLSRHCNKIKAFIHIVRVALRQLIMSSLAKQFTHPQILSIMKLEKLGTDVHFANS